MKKNFEKTIVISSMLITLASAGCGNPAQPPPINDLTGVKNFMLLDSLDFIPADGISTIDIKDSIPTLGGGASITFGTNYGTFLPEQGLSTLATGSQSITVLAVGDTAHALLVSGLDVVDTVIITAGSGSSFLRGRVRFIRSYPDSGGLLLASNVYYIPSKDSDLPPTTPIPTLSVGLVKLHGKVSNHFPITFQTTSIPTHGTPSLDLPQTFYIEHQDTTLPFHSNSIDSGSGVINIIASYQYLLTPDSVVTASDTLSIVVY